MSKINRIAKSQQERRFICLLVSKMLPEFPTLEELQDLLDLIESKKLSHDITASSQAPDFLKLLLHREHLNTLMKTQLDEPALPDLSSATSLNDSLDNIPELTSILSDLRSRLNVYTTYKRQLKQVQSATDSDMLPLSLLSLDSAEETRFVKTLIKHTQKVEEAMKGDRAVLEKGSMETERYLGLYEDLLSASRAHLDFKPKEFVETEFSKPISDVREFCEIVPGIQIFKDGLTKTLDQHVRENLCNSYLPLCRNMYMSLEGNFNGIIQPAAKQLMLYQRDQQIEIQKFMDKEV